MTSAQQTIRTRQWATEGPIATCLVATLLVVCSAFIGGFVIALFVAASLLFATATAGRIGTPASVSVGIVATASLTIVEFMLLLPAIRSVAVLRKLLFSEQTIQPFIARDTELRHLVELNRAGAALVSLIPVVIAFVFLRRTKSQGTRRRLSISMLLIVFLPLLLATYSKFRSPLEYLVSTASGDGRNLFLHVQRIRVTSGFTNISNFTTQGDFGASLSSLVSDGFGSNGILQFGDQYAAAATYVLFAILLASSAAAVTQTLASRTDTSSSFQPSAVANVFMIFSVLLSVTMPWVMNEMFRSGFFSAVLAMSLCSVVPLVLFARFEIRLSLVLLASVSVLVFATYQIAVLYVLIGLTIVCFPHVLAFVRRRPVFSVISGLGSAFLTVLAIPSAKQQLSSRLLLEGSITYLSDSVWTPLAISGVLLAFAKGKPRLLGLYIFGVAGVTSGFQLVARVLREDQGQSGYGYYGAKVAYIGFFLVIFILICSCASIVVSQLKAPDTGQSSSLGARLRSTSLALGILILGATMNDQLLPESRGFFGSSKHWTQPTAEGLRLAVSYWDEPKVIFVRVSDPGNDRITNFWHPYFWSGVPWTWSYSSYTDEPIALCQFINDEDTLVVTQDSDYAATLRQTCDPRIEIAS